MKRTKSGTAPKAPALAPDSVGPSIVPFSLKDAPALIERIFPAQKVSIESQTERKAAVGQTLTALGSYWKGRKPLVLVRACVLGALLPATDRPEKDLRIFELLMAMNDAAFVHRLKSVSKADVLLWGGSLRDELLDDEGRWCVTGEERRNLLGCVLARMPYADRLHGRSLRPEELPETAYQGIWDEVNSHLGTRAHSHSELVEQLGVMRFGHRPRVADTFSGGGSIPFEAARLGCDVFASDLNPIACMLTWGAINIIGAAPEDRARIQNLQEQIAAKVDAEISTLGIEHSESGLRAKAYLYCVETTCPNTGWSVPLAPSWIISNAKRCVARLVPNPAEKRFEIDIEDGVDAATFEAARRGTVIQGDMVYMLEGKEHRVSIKTLRGDNDQGGNRLRQWEKSDVAPRVDDIFRERLYCIQWTAVDGSTFFRSPTDHDLAMEQRAESLARESLAEWQAAGLVPDQAIESGDETSRLARERGWTHWHHLFRPRELLAFSLWRRFSSDASSYLTLALLLDLGSKLCQWMIGTAKADANNGLPRRGGGPPGNNLPNHVFYNQALNPFFNFATRSFAFHRKTVMTRVVRDSMEVRFKGRVNTASARETKTLQDVFITDPPYADAIRYEEITEYFIAWLRKNPPAPFDEWVWDSRRDLAIKGSHEDFRREMVMAYKAMTDHMPDNGLQIVMFTHQDARVWGDMAGIFWGAGLRVTAAWCVATETESAIKAGGYVQGTVLLALRKRQGTSKTYKAELVQEIRDEVAQQIETLTGLNQAVRAGGRDENLFEDVDLQLAGYAAALRVLTGYTHLDGKDMTEEALRPRPEGQSSPVEEIIDYAVQIANEHLVPDGLDARVWEELSGVERFYLRMLDREAGGLKKLDAYQSFAKAFKVKDYRPLLASVKANDARLKSAKELKKAEVPSFEIDKTPLRAVLYALAELQGEGEAEDALHHLRDNVRDYFQRRKTLEAMSKFLALKLDRLREDEASAARVLEGLIRNEKLGG